MSFEQGRLLLPHRLRGGKPLAGELLSQALRALIPQPRFGSLRVQTPAGTFALDSGEPGPTADVIIRSWRVLARLWSSSAIAMAESYMRGEWESPDLHAVMHFACINGLPADKPLRGGFWQLAARLRHAMNRNTRRGSRRNIAAHYDLGNDFYRSWLDAGVNYSAAIFSSPEQGLEAAQAAKLRRIADLLDLQPGNALLEIGCGWGALAEQVLLDRGASRITALTLSHEQAAFVRNRLSRFVADGRCDVRLQDYRDVGGQFDRIASIEMLEAVGEAYWPTYFRKLRECLRPGGIAVLQVITIADSQFRAYRAQPDFIQSYIFPGGMLPTKAAIRHQAEEAGLQLVHQEFFGASYARTLHHWEARFAGVWPRLRDMGFDERFGRMWRFYLAYCRVGFEAGIIDVGLYRIVRGKD